MILTVEHTSGDIPCHFCRAERDRRALNLKIQWFPGGPGNTERYRLCRTCAERLYKDLEQALRTRP